MVTVENPILRGFNPDPSIIRVGEDYYIATSTFEWFPGVQIHHSRDLANWELVKRPLERLSQLDLTGVTDSGGVWAPCLSYDEGTFYLVYSNVKNFDGVWKDTPNYLVTANDILGDWSDPVFLSSTGFDGSLFHDEDGRKWFISMCIDHRYGKFFGGIVMQEYDPAKQQLTGPVHELFQGTNLGKTEGPHLYRYNDYYYLIMAEGGTEYDHAVTVARSKDLFGPYEVHPKNPLISSKDDPQWPLQKAGHGDLVMTDSGEWYITYLVSRPLRNGRCVLGRETALQPVHWENDWPMVSDKRPSLNFEAIGGPMSKTDFSARFHEGILDLDFQSLRQPINDSWCTLEARAGYLRLYGGESLSSKHRQSLIARRIDTFKCTIVTQLDFHPENFQQMAGLVCFYNTYHFHYLYVSVNDEGQKCLDIITCDQYEFSHPMKTPIVLNAGEILLRAQIDHESLVFGYSQDGKSWNNACSALDLTILSDDYVQHAQGRYRAAFTGAFVGLCCQDLTGHRKHADFKSFQVMEKNVSK